MLDINVVRVSDGSFIVRLMEDRGVSEITTHRTLDELVTRITALVSPAAIPVAAPTQAQ